MPMKFYDLGCVTTVFNDVMCSFARGHVIGRVPRCINIISTDWCNFCEFILMSVLMVKLNVHMQHVGAV